MSIADYDRLLASLQRIGQAGALPKNASVPQLVDELQRELGALGTALSAVLSELRAGPGYPRDAKLFLVDGRIGFTTYNILTSAQANIEGFGLTDGLAVFKHGLGYKLDRWVIVDRVMKTLGAGASPTGQPLRTPGIVRWGFNDNQTIFQIDQEASAQEMAFLLSCYSSYVVPSKAVNKGQAQKTGASSPQTATIRAYTAKDLP